MERPRTVKKERKNMQSILNDMAGNSYQKRVADINAIYEKHAKRGINNRDIWRWYVWPVYQISERTFYNYLKQGGR